jgi:hypothetical protein
MSARLKNPFSIAAYDRKKETLAAAAGPRALSLQCRTSEVSVDGTDDVTVDLPVFPGQYKTVNVIAGANTPILRITVIGMRLSTHNVWSLAGFNVNTGHVSITYYSPDGLVWDVVGSTGTVTVA